MDPNETVTRMAADIASGLAEGDDPIEVALAALSMAEPQVIALVRERLDGAEAHLFDAKEAWLEGDGERAIGHLDECIETCRRPGSRDPSMESRARMERGIVRASMGDESADSDLRWAMDRFAAIEPEGPLHGLSILNLAGWHEARGERMMAMAILASISRSSGHDRTIIGLSRQRSAILRATMGDIPSASRLHWSAWRLLEEEGRAALAEVSALHFIDMALGRLDDGGQRMDAVVESAAPEGNRSASQEAVHPDDIALILDSVGPRIVTDPSGEHRPDLVLYLEATLALGRTVPSDLADHASLEDPAALELLQS